MKLRNRLKVITLFILVYWREIMCDGLTAANEINVQPQNDRYVNT
jgi:hypothetical protein